MLRYLKVPSSSLVFNKTNKWIKIKKNQDIICDSFVHSMSECTFLVSCVIQISITEGKAVHWDDNYDEEQEKAMWVYLWLKWDNNYFIIVSW